MADFLRIITVSSLQMISANSLQMITVNSLSGDYSSSSFIIVDSETNRAYYSVSRSNTDGTETVCNVQVNDIPKKKNKYIFSDNSTYAVNLVLFEEKIDKKENRKVFHSSNAYCNEN